MEMTNKQSRRKRRGFVLPLTVAMIVLLTIMGLSLQRLGSGARMQAVFATAQITATAAADAGFTKAMYEMNKNLDVKPWNFSDVTDEVDNMALTNANADYTYTIEEIVRDSEYKITSIGQSGWAAKTVSATVKVQGGFDYAIFAQGYAIPKRPKAPKQNPPPPKPLKKGGKLEIKGYNVDSYSSDPSQAYSGIIQLRTNNKHKKSVKFREDVVINADIVVGPGGDPNKVIEMKHGAVVTGDAYAATERRELLSVTVPGNLDNQPLKEYEYKDNVPIAGINKYDELKIPNGKVQEINGNCVIYVVGNVKVEDNAQLILTENASLTLYVAGEKFEVKKKSGGLINETQDPTKLLIYGLDACRKVKIEKETAGDFYGAVYAPFAKVEMKTNGDLYGAFAGWDVKLKKKKGGEQGTFYFDRSLRIDNVAATDALAVRFVVKGWREE